jgi:hypothetical protein
MSGDDPLEEELQADPEVWTLDQELNIAAEVYSPEHKGIFAADLEGEDLVDRFRTLLGFDVMWEQPTAGEPGEPEDPGEEAG